MYLFENLVFINTSIFIIQRCCITLQRCFIVSVIIFIVGIILFVGIIFNWSLYQKNDKLDCLVSCNILNILESSHNIMTQITTCTSIVPLDLLWILFSSFSRYWAPFSSISSSSESSNSASPSPSSSSEAESLKRIKNEIKTKRLEWPYISLIQI